MAFKKYKTICEDCGDVVYKQRRMTSRDGVNRCRRCSRKKWSSDHIKKHGPPHLNPRYAGRSQLDREYLLRTKYGMTQNDYDKMFEDQRGRCAICRRPQKSSLDIDHSHITGRVRGLLCGNCNRGLGLFSDDPDILDAAAQYLR